MTSNQRIEVTPVGAFSGPLLIHAHAVLGSRPTTPQENQMRPQAWTVLYLPWGEVQVSERYSDVKAALVLVDQRTVR